MLSDIISENQSAFIPNRLITNNALIALELFHTMKKRSKGKGSMALKLDMSKAYDRVEWTFVERLLIKMGFDKGWTSKLIHLISGTTYFVLVNRVPHEIRTPSRGLRQGDPLSPYLFILVTDALSGLMKRAVDDNSIHGVRGSRNGPSISHLLFVDDILLFSRAN